MSSSGLLAYRWALVANVQLSDGRVSQALSTTCDDDWQEAFDRAASSITRVGGTAPVDVWGSILNADGSGGGVYYDHQLGRWEIQ